MLAKKYKLPIREFFIQKAKFLGKSPYFGIKIRQNNLKYSRFGVIVGKKVFPKAASRNKIKRIIFNFIKKEKLQLNPGQDVLISVFPKAVILEKTNIEKEMESLKKIFK